MNTKIIDGILIEWAGQEIISATAENSRPLTINEIPEQTLWKWNTVKNQESPATQSGRPRPLGIDGPDQPGEGKGAAMLPTSGYTTALPAMHGTSLTRRRMYEQAS